MIREIYFLEDLPTGLKVWVYEDVTPPEARVDRHAQQTLMVRSGLSKLLASEDVQLEHEASGAPFLASHPHVHISISHSHDFYALILHPEKEVGIDLQRKRPTGFPSALHYFLTEEEMSIPYTDHELYVLWCAKEALYKRARGEMASYRDDMQIDAIGAGMLLGRVKNEFVRCTHVQFGEELVLVYC